jgi:uncharacterized protein YjiS (DUF1127 family)
MTLTHRLFQHLFAWQRRRAMFHATHASLRALDARALRDIGLHPSEILSVACEAAGHAEHQRLFRLHSQT